MLEGWLGLGFGIWDFCWVSEDMLGPGLFSGLLRWTSHVPSHGFGKLPETKYLRGPCDPQSPTFLFWGKGGAGGGGYGLIRVFGLRVEGSGRLGFWSSGGGAGQVANSWALRVHGAF